MALRSFTSAEATALFESNPGKLLIRLPDVLLLFNMTGEELQAELVSGRLRSTGVKVPGGYTDVAVRVPDLLDWATKTGRQFSTEKARH